MSVREKPPVYPQVTMTQGGQTTIVTRMQPRFDEYQQSLVCPNCRANIVTRTVYKNGLLTWISAGVMFMLGLWCCCCIPGNDYKKVILLLFTVISEMCRMLHPSNRIRRNCDHNNEHCEHCNDTNPHHSDNYSSSNWNHGSSDDNDADDNSNANNYFDNTNHYYNMQVKRSVEFKICAINWQI
ncbi:hypothetical protein WR25_25782 [Diploscapter pachys]|uniref:LITAF domain-containing protein n=1 Tax=Diploscapter pachys TaxID=2018661 RepID=A0A2A2LNN1_9BILA|nr:hypothetical protein WR25_25782 [Diploscapter pachys]